MKFMITKKSSGSEPCEEEKELRVTRKPVLILSASLYTQRTIPTNERTSKVIHAAYKMEDT